MQVELTPGAERGLAAATAWATRLGEAEVGPLHLLLGLLDEDEGLVARLFEKQGLGVATIREGLIADAPLEPVQAGTADPRPLEHGSIRALVFAAQPLALSQTGERSVASHHLFAALLQKDAGLGTLLARWGFRAEAALAQMGEAASEPLLPDEPLSEPATSDPVAASDTARLLDACANRAREAARVLEDFARFSLNDAHLSGQLKQLRHDLATLLGEGGQQVGWLEARDTRRDVGVGLSTASEGVRAHPRAVAAANAKRLQEALRSLEEFSKIHAPDRARRLERLRYASYTLEKALLVGAQAQERLASVRLAMLISVSTSAAALEWTIAEAVAGGVDLIQLREKNMPDREWLQRARRAVTAARQAGVLVVVNDRPDLARLAEADGVHLGQADLPVSEARRVLGPDRLIGVSTHSDAEMADAQADGAHMIGVGPVFPSQTKSFERLAGLELVRAAAERNSLPAFAIGGIHPGNVAQVVAAGLRRVAVGHALTQADDPCRVARELRAALEG
ncbi:MAG TPA: thiamine phosphate synthase [Gemmatales bacterium]|nr:thiamine phosphate synthase [Gemmatales bacterium]HMP59215.1 thiamine phosphate synthase [Gemmatales bacterium]